MKEDSPRFKNNLVSILLVYVVHFNQNCIVVSQCLFWNCIFNFSLFQFLYFENIHFGSYAFKKNCYFDLYLQNFTINFIHNEKPLI